jgi:hypothetical protein
VLQALLKLTAATPTQRGIRVVGAFAVLVVGRIVAGMVRRGVYLKV